MIRDNEIRWRPVNTNDVPVPYYKLSVLRERFVIQNLLLCARLFQFVFNIVVVGAARVVYASSLITSLL